MHSHHAAVLTHIGLSLLFCTIQTVQQFVVSYIKYGISLCNVKPQTEHSTPEPGTDYCRFSKVFPTELQSSNRQSKAYCVPDKQLPSSALILVSCTTC